MRGRPPQDDGRGHLHSILSASVAVERPRLPLCKSDATATATRMGQPRIFRRWQPAKATLCRGGRGSISGPRDHADGPDRRPPGVRAGPAFRMYMTADRPLYSVANCVVGRCSCAFPVDLYAVGVRLSLGFALCTAVRRWSHAGHVISSYVAILNFP